MEKRFFYAFIISFCFLVLYSSFVSKKFIAQTPQEEAVQKPLSEQEVIKKPQSIIEEYLIQVNIGNFFVTYSPRGGYVKNLLIKSYNEELPFNNIGYTPEYKDEEFTANLQGEKLIFTSPGGYTKEFDFQGYELAIKTTLPITKVIAFSNSLSVNDLEKRYEEFFYWENSIMQRKKFNDIVPGKSFFKNFFEKNAIEESKEISYDKIEFAGARSRYFCVALLKDIYNIKWVRNEKEIYLYLTPPCSQIKLYIGPQIEENLKPLNLQEIINYGFFHGVGVVMIKLLNFFYFLTKNWGVSIIIFSIAIYIILSPLTLKSAKGMKQMRDFQVDYQAEIKKIKEKYSGDAHKQHQATLELYKKHGMNPLKGCSSGCLPAIIQIPVFFTLWDVIPRNIQFKGVNFLWIGDLSLPDRLFHLPFSLPFIGEWINLLPLLTAGIMYLQMKFSNPAIDPEQAQQQKMMSVVFLVMFAMIFYNLPSALLLYWFINSILTFFFQWKITRTQA